MKNLKDEIEGIMNEHSYKQDVRDFGKPATVTQYKAIDLVEAITSLIEQEKERVELEALDRLCDWYIGQGFRESEVKEFKRRYSQYLAERKG